MVITFKYEKIYCRNTAFVFHFKKGKDILNHVIKLCVMLNQWMSWY